MGTCRIRPALHRVLRATAAALLLTAAAACADDDATSPPVDLPPGSSVPASQLHFVPVGRNTPALATTTTSSLAPPFCHLWNPTTLFVLFTWKKFVLFPRLAGGYPGYSRIRFGRKISVVQRDVEIRRPTDTRRTPNDHASSPSPSTTGPRPCPSPSPSPSPSTPEPRRDPVPGPNNR